MKASDIAKFKAAVIKADIAAAQAEAELEGKPKERQRINTAKVLNNTYFTGDGMGDEYFAPARTM